MSELISSGAIAGQETQPQSDSTAQKQVYEKPQFIYRAPLEAMAGTGCSIAAGGKNYGFPGGCNFTYS